MPSSALALSHGNMPNTSKKRKAAAFDGGRQHPHTAKPVKKSKKKTTAALDDIPFSTESPLLVKVEGDDAFVGTEDLADGFSFDYAVRPGSRWRDMRSYRNVKYSGNNFSTGSIVYINKTSPPPKPPPDDATDEQILAYDRSSFWVARIADTRAENDREVYLRVYWLYWPEELPMGRQPYHADNELVLSNAMDIVDAQTISSIAEVHHWDELNFEAHIEDRFWRQTFDIGLLGKNKDGGLSRLNGHCKCQEPYNPDRNMYQCREATCGTWNHEHCLIADIQDLVSRRSPGENWESAEEKQVKQEETKDGLNLLSPLRDLGRFVQNKVLPAIHPTTEAPANSENAAESKAVNGTAAVQAKSEGESDQLVVHRQRSHNALRRDKQCTYEVSLLEPQGEEGPLLAQVREVAVPNKKKKTGSEAKAGPEKTWQLQVKCLKCDRPID